MAIDPVCLMEVEEATAQWTSEYKGQTYYFCAPGCKVSFDEDPDKYLNGGDMEHDHDHADHMHAGGDHEGHSHDAGDHASDDHPMNNEPDHAGDGHTSGDHSSDDHR